MKPKTISSTRSSISSVMLPAQANPAGNVHGGEIMKMMDVAASVTAIKHAKCNVVTLRVDELIFHHPIYVGQLVTCESEMVYVGSTSMEIKVTVKVENMESDDEPMIAQTAYFTFVALDKNGKSTKVPQLILETEEERVNFEMGEERKKQYKQRG